jgi:hypothetical protein
VNNENYTSYALMYITTNILENPLFNKHWNSNPKNNNNNGACLELGTYGPAWSTVALARGRIAGSSILTVTF